MLKPLMAWLGAVLLAVLTLGGAHAQSAAMERIALTHDRLERIYHLFTPSSGGSGERPLVVVLHEGGITPQSMADITSFNTLAQKHGFLVAYPLGTGRSPSWNAGRCCGYAERQNVDDVGFIEALVQDVQSRHKVDRQRVYAAGLGNGGMMAYRLACESSSLFSAVAPVSAAMNTHSCNHAAGRPSLILFHALDDRMVAYAGGVPQRGERSLVSRRGMADASVADAMRFWTENNFCRDFPAMTEIGEVSRVTYFCAEGRHLELNTLRTGGHSWPGGKPSFEGADTPNPDVQATEEIWRFFQRHPPTELF